MFFKNDIKKVTFLVKDNDFDVAFLKIKLFLTIVEHSSQNVSSVIHQGKLSQ